MHCDASTSRTCDVPIPNATAPKAPCVEVWLSPHAIVIAGWVRPELRTDDVDDPLHAARKIEQADAGLATVPFQRREHVLGHEIAERPPLIQRRDDMVDRRDRPFGELDLPPSRPQHVERLWSRDLVDEMQADEQLGLPVRQPPDRVRIPDLLEQSR